VGSSGRVKPGYEKITGGGKVTGKSNLFDRRGRDNTGGEGSVYIRGVEGSYNRRGVWTIQIWGDQR